MIEKKERKECPICFKNLTLDNALSWLECPHSVCIDCFIKSGVVYAFENMSMKIECPMCRTDVNRLTGGAELITVDMWTKLFRTVRRKKCKKCGEKDSPTPVVKDIDSCSIHQEMCMDCGIQVTCKPPNCFFLKCLVCEEREMTPNFIGCFTCGVCVGHQKETIHTLNLLDQKHRDLVGLCYACYGLKPLCANHWKIDDTLNKKCDCHQ